MKTTLSILLTIGLACTGLVAAEPKADNPLLEPQTAEGPDYCDRLLAGLPAFDPQARFPGRVTTTRNQGGHTHRVAVFGREEGHYEYFVDGPELKGLTNRITCKKIPLSLMAKAVLQEKRRNYLVTLKNGTSYETPTSRPFSVRDKPNDRMFTRLTGGPDKEKGAWLWIVATDAAGKERQAIAVNPAGIAVVEVE